MTIERTVPQLSENAGAQVALGQWGRGLRHLTRLAAACLGPLTHPVDGVPAAGPQVAPAAQTDQRPPAPEPQGLTVPAPTVPAPTFTHTLPRDAVRYFATTRTVTAQPFRSGLTVTAGGHGPLVFMVT